MTAFETVFEDWRFGDEGKVSDELTAAPQVSANRDALQFRVSLAQHVFGIFQQHRRPMHVPEAFAAAADFDILEYLCLQGRPKASPREAGPRTSHGYEVAARRHAGG